MTPCVWFRRLSAVLTALWVHATNAAVERLYRGVDAP